MFSCCLSLSAHMRLYVRLSCARCRTNQWMELHQTLVDDVVEATNELVRFLKVMGSVQGHGKVKQLSELLLWSEDPHRRLGVDVSSTYCVL